MRLVRYRWLLSAAAYFSPLAIPVAVPLHAQAVAGAGVISGTVLATGSETPIANAQIAVQGTGRLTLSDANGDRKSTRLNSSHLTQSRMPSSA